MNIKELKKELFKNSSNLEKEYNRIDPAFDIAETIITLRISKGWTQTKLANKAGIKQPSLARLEGGDYWPNLKTINKVIKALGFNIDFKKIILNPENNNTPEVETKETFIKDNKLIQNVSFMYDLNIVSEAGIDKIKSNDLNYINN